MWIANNNDLTMAENDYGIALPITIQGMTFAAGDCVKIVIKKAQNGEAILTKEFSNITENTIDLEFTEAESALLPVGKYVYRMDAYQDGNFLCNIIPTAVLKVVDVA